MFYMVNLGKKVYKSKHKTKIGRLKSYISISNNITENQPCRYLNNLLYL